MRSLGMIACALVLGLCGFVLSGVVHAQEATTDQSTMDQVVSPQDAGTTVGDTGEGLPHRKLVMTENEIRAYRLKLWAALLKGDMKDVYDAYGAPSTRYRESTMGRVIEKWTYADQGKEFSFQDGKLMKTVDFQPGSR
jgi:hypothetical protein